MKNFNNNLKGEEIEEEMGKILRIIKDKNESNCSSCSGNYHRNWAENLIINSDEQKEGRGELST